MKKSTHLLILSSDLWNLSDGMLGPLFAVFSQQIGGNILNITWAWATYLITAGVLTILIGKASDHKKHKEYILFTGYFLNTLFTFSYLLVSSPLHLFLVQIGYGISLALISPSWGSLFSHYMDKKHEGTLWGRAGGEAKILTGIALIIGGCIVNYYSFKALFIIMGIIQLCATLTILPLLKSNHQSAK